MSCTTYTMEMDEFGPKKQIFSKEMRARESGSAISEFTKKAADPAYTVGISFKKKSLITAGTLEPNNSTLLKSDMILLTLQAWGTVCSSPHSLTSHSN